MTTSSTPQAETRTIELTVTPHPKVTYHLHGESKLFNDPFCGDDWAIQRRPKNSEEPFTRSFLMSGSTKHYHVCVHTVGFDPETNIQHVFCLHFPSTASEDKMTDIELRLHDPCIEAKKSTITAQTRDGHNIQLIQRDRECPLWTLPHRRGVKIITQTMQLVLQDTNFVQKTARSASD